MKQPPMICALGVIQPWAHCIAHKGKIIAKRSAKVVAR